MDKKQTKPKNKKSTLEAKLETLTEKLEVLESRGPGWNKAKARTSLYIEQVKAEMSKKATTKKGGK